MRYIEGQRAYFLSAEALAVFKLLFFRPPRIGMPVRPLFIPATSFRSVLTAVILMALLFRSWICGAAVIALCIYGVVRFDGYSDKVIEDRRFRPKRMVTGRWRFLINVLLHNDLAALAVAVLVFRGPALGLSCIAAVLAMLTGWPIWR